MDWIEGHDSEPYQEPCKESCRSMAAEDENVPDYLLRRSPRFFVAQAVRRHTCSQCIFLGQIFSLLDYVHLCQIFSLLDCVHWPMHTCTGDLQSGSSWQCCALVFDLNAAVIDPNAACAIKPHHCRVGGFLCEIMLHASLFQNITDIARGVTATQKLVCPCQT